MPQAFGTRIIAASEAQIQENRLSAQRSSGPQTENGKRAVHYNALKHGLLAEASLLPGEDAALFMSGSPFAHPPSPLLPSTVDKATSFSYAYISRIGDRVTEPGRWLPNEEAEMPKKVERVSARQAAEAGDRTPSLSTLIEFACPRSRAWPGWSWQAWPPSNRTPG
jgi:hypothetical protein